MAFGRHQIGNRANHSTSLLEKALSLLASFVSRSLWNRPDALHVEGGLITRAGSSRLPTSRRFGMAAL